MLNKLDLGSYSWVCAWSFSSFGGSMVRALDYLCTGCSNGAEVRASAVHFSFLEFFFKKTIFFYLSFIISIIIAILLQLSFIIFDYGIRPFTYSRIPSIEVSDCFFQHRLKLFMDKICYHILEFYSACAGLKQTFSNS